MTDFELVKSRLDARKKGTPMDLEEANKIFKDTTIYIYKFPNRNQYGWSAIMGEDGYFNTPRSAVNSALEYLKSGNY